MDLSIRSSGILLPIFSLPGTADCGALGENARQFADWLARAGQTWWQMLPINPIDRSFSPYASLSAFAGEPIYIDLNELAQENLLTSEEVALFSSQQTADDRVNYSAARHYRLQMQRRAFDRFQSGSGGTRYRDRLNSFLAENNDWLTDFVLFSALAEKFDTSSWSHWPEEYRHRSELIRPDGSFTDRIANDQSIGDAMEFAKFQQLVFDVQWTDFKTYCHTRGIYLLGDVPIYVGSDGADTWAHPELFQINADGQLLRVAGVPGDAFNPKGQRWNMPLYDWAEHEKTGFRWWLARMKQTLNRFDAVRLDHFIGFYNFYSFPADENLPPDTTRITDDQGHTYEPGWVPGPQEKLFDTLFNELPKESFLAEDLGVMNEGVHRLRNQYQLPGMAVLQFSFDNPAIGNPIRTWPQNFVVCTGTHDTPPILAWLTGLEMEGCKNSYGPDFLPVWKYLRKMQKKEERIRISRRQRRLFCSGQISSNWNWSIKKEEDEQELLFAIPKRPIPMRPEIVALKNAIIRAVLNSAGNTALFPIQDVLGLGAETRINFPGIEGGNWLWRLRSENLSEKIASKMSQMTKQAKRSSNGQ